MHQDRIDRVRQFIIQNDLDYFLVTVMPEIRWCCGFSGSAGTLIIGRDTATLLTDGRYRTQVQQEVRGVRFEIYAKSAVEHLTERGFIAPGARVGFDGEAVSVGLWQKLTSSLPGVELRSFSHPFDPLLASKNEVEISALRQAQSITDQVFHEILSVIRPGLTEKHIAAEITCRFLQKGAERMSFDPIVASGRNGALPHARPTEKTIDDGDLVVLDFGCFVDGYASDMTRTIAMGQPGPDALKAYDAVRTAQSAAEHAARPGMVAGDLDRVGRSIIEEAGLGDAFSHSLGHGLGLRVHEWPRIGRDSNEVLPENVVITIEPGVYIPDQFGIRIENSIIIRSSGSEALPSSETALIVI